MSSRQLLVALLLLFVIASPSPAGDLMERAERAAAAIPWYDVGDAVYNRDPRRGPDATKVVAGLKMLEKPVSEPASRLLATGWTADEIRPLLKHKNPKVRTLGLVLLYDLERVDVLSDIATLAEDAAETFPAPGPISALALPAPEPWPMEKTTVRKYAMAMIKRYCEHSAALSGLRLWQIKSEDLRTTLAEFAAKRDPILCTPAFAVAMDRATGGISPIQDDRRVHIEAVLFRLEQVAMPRRFFVAVSIDFDRFHNDRYPSDYLLMLAREVPRDSRIAAISGKRPVDDPDLPLGAGGSFFLKHAADLFTQKDADLIQQIGKPQRCAEYAIAAATLRQERAEAILTDELAQFSGEFEDSQRADLAVALARLAPERAMPTAIKCFFDERPRRGVYGAGRERFLGGLQASDPLRFRKAVELIIRDERLTTLGPATTRTLIQAVGGYLGRELADEDQLRDSYGIDEAQRYRKFKHLADWHRRLKETLDEWSR
jgi:hypothetical protein